MVATLAENNNEPVSASQFVSLTPKKAKHGSRSVVILCLAGPFGVLHHSCFPPSFLRPRMLVFKTPACLLPLLQNRHKQLLGSADAQGLQVYHSAFEKLYACVCICVCVCVLEDKWLWMTLNIVAQSLSFSELYLYDIHFQDTSELFTNYICVCVCVHVFVNYDFIRFHLHCVSYNKKLMMYE